MKWKVQTYPILMLVMAVALAGLVVVQLFLLNNTREMKAQTFRQNVNVALSSIVQKVAAHEALVTVVGIALEDSLGEKPAWLQNPGEVRVDMDSLGQTQIMLFEPEIPRATTGRQTDSLRFAFKFVVADSIMARRLDSSHQKQPQISGTGKTIGETQTQGRRHVVQKSYSYSVTDSGLWVDAGTRGSKPSEALQVFLTDENRRVLVRRTLEALDHTQQRSLEQRITPAVLDSIVKITLGENGIDLTCSYGVYSTRQDSLVLSVDTADPAALLRSEFATPLFPFDLFFGDYVLRMHFPQRDWFIGREVAPLLLTSLLLMGTIAGAFIIAMRTLYRQRRFGAALTDFINNMTHEFKTPISTISLAAEALANTPEQQPEKRQRYAMIIRDENARMRGQVEKILQMAVLEKGDFELHIAMLDAHEVIKTAIENIALQVEKRKGRIISRLQAEESRLQADPVHLASLIHNMLDNALKYTQAEPRIVVATANRKGRFVIRIEDNGIGISAEDQQRIFEKYFRVSTGNVHDVKGFGLGLSYVKMMVEAHGGTIAVASEPGRGTAFEICLPYEQKRSSKRNGDRTHTTG